MRIDLNDILNKFSIESTIEEYGNGHINDTYLTNSPNYILQRINTSIFKNPDELMENIDNVTSFLRKKIVAAGGNPERETLKVLKTNDGKNYYRYDDNNVFRVYNFIENTKSIENSVTLENIHNAGVGFGKFQRMLDDFPVEKLHETIKNFHDTPKRVEALKTAIEEDRAGRRASVEAEIEFALSNSDFAGTVVNEIAKGNIPVRVTHNDTKINNILFDVNTEEAVCVIDLDTVMPGSALYDFGDALRMGGSTAAEDETNLDIVNFNAAAFEAFAKGYCSQMKEFLTETELEYLPMSVRLLTYECGIRFLTDYLNGDTYFKIHREHHNLDRARNQFKLVSDLKTKEDELKKIIEKI
mgnify:FL=1